MFGVLEPYNALDVFLPLISFREGWMRMHMLLNMSQCLWRFPHTFWKHTNGQNLHKFVTPSTDCLWLFVCNYLLTKVNVLKNHYLQNWLISHMKFWNCWSFCKDKKITATGCHQKQSDSQLPLTQTSGESVPFLLDSSMNVYWSCPEMADLSSAFRFLWILSWCTY